MLCMTTRPDLPATPDGNYAEALNARKTGWSAAMGIHFLRATAEEVVAELTIGPAHLQAYGIVHGGVHAGLVETVASVGAALAALPRGQSVVGLENHTSFLNAVREGLLRATARPLMRGRRTQVWEAAITSADGRTVASGQVRFLALEGGAALAGETIQLKHPELRSF
jgi:1,4-dihydroxy-2-naphthoyl-CoA hydrolase